MALMTVLLVACSGPDAGAPTPIPTVAGEKEVALEFRDFYASMGGRAVLGPAISDPIMRDGILEQYTTNGLMRYNAQAPTTLLYSLAPLGERFVPVEDGGPFEIDPLFQPVFDKLQGHRFIGAPISGVISDKETGKYCQFFQGLGMCAMEGNPEVIFMEYGAWYCARMQEACQYQSSASINAKGYNEKFIIQVRRLGRELTGYPISPVFRTLDGSLVQVYDNVVIVDRTGDNPNGRQVIELYFFTTQIGIEPGPLELNMNDSRMTFIRTEGELGYNVPNVFIDYIAMHGGQLASGKPITGLTVVNDQPGVYRVCFEAYCLDYNDGLPEGKNIYPVPLGWEYLKKFDPEDLAQRGLAPTEDDIHIKLWEEKPLVSSSERPRINIMVFQRGDQEPIPNIDLTVTVMMPDGQLVTFIPSPTNMNGLSALELDPIAGENGTMIPYQVCLNMSSTGQPLCMEDALVIWSNP